MKGFKHNKSVADVFAMVDTSQPGCWEWPGNLSVLGYGRVQLKKKLWYAHRLVFEFVVGKIPSGLVLDHLCMNPQCCRPDHLEAVTPGENALRGVGVVPTNLAKTHCPKGHPYSDDNTCMRRQKSGRIHRMCLACNRFRNRAYRSQEQAA
jgi:hypothetical protein